MYIKLLFHILQFSALCLISGPRLFTQFRIFIEIESNRIIHFSQTLNLATNCKLFNL